MFSIKSKIIAAISITMAVVFAGFGFYIYHEVRRVSLEKIDIRLESLVEKLHDEIEEENDERGFPREAEFVHIREDILPLSVFRLADSAGTIVYGDSLFLGVGPMPLEELKTRGEMSGEVWLNGLHYRTFARRMRIHSSPSTLQAAASMETFDSTLENLSLLLWTTIPFVLLLSAGTVYVIVRRAFRPLTVMIETANRVSISTLHERIAFPRGKDEVAVLGSSLNRMMERLEASFKNQKQFIADASHEIRTPITIIQSELEYANRSKLSDPASRSIGLALEELDHLRKLAGDLLLLARLEFPAGARRFHLVRMDQLTVDCVQRLSRAAAEKKVAIRCSIGDAVEVPGDEEKLRSALLNVIENALKYTPGGGVVDVCLTVEGERARLVVHDNGRGISSSDLPHIFKPFYRSVLSRSDHSGSGLGLSIVQRIVEMHAGSVSADSNGNEGSTFTIEIPVAPRES